MHRPQQMSTDPEEILYGAVDGREALQMGGRLEAAHLAFALSSRLMRDFSAVIGVLVRDVDHRRHHDAAGCWVAPQLVRDQPARDTSLALQQLPEESDSGSPISSRLHEDVEDVAVLIDGAPQILSAALQRHEQFVEMPRIAEVATAFPESSGVSTTECSTPLTNGLVSDRDPALGEEVFDIPETQAEPKVEPDGVGDDGGGESISVVAGGVAVHPTTLIPSPST